MKITTKLSKILPNPLVENFRKLLQGQSSKTVKQAGEN